MEKSFERKKKWTNKGTDWQHVANTQYNLSYLMFVPNFKILSQEVPEKSLTEKIVYTHRQPYGKSKIGIDSHSKRGQSFRIFEIIIFCFVVALCDLVNTVEATYGLP